MCSSDLRDIRLLRGEAILQVRSDRRTFLPWGLNGGKDGTPSWNIINPETGGKPVPSKITQMIKGGDVYRHVTGGGGGYGSPLLRDPAAVAEDVRDGKLTRDYAEREYGVVFIGDSLVLDLPGTEKRRSQLEPSSSAAA